MKRIDDKQIKEILNGTLSSSDYPPVSLPIKKIDREQLDIIVKNAIKERNKAAMAVLITLCVKKILTPKQDIRKHQAGMEDGFSGRSMDSRSITPFLKKNNFPAMTSGSGWLTRSFEQAAPYDLNYPGRIQPIELKKAFLELVNEIQSSDDGKKLANFYLCYMFAELKKFREIDESLVLSRPKNKSVADAVSLVEKLWKMKISGASRVPVLGVYAAYQCLVKEVGRYKNHELLELLPHNAPDTKTNRAGDIDLVVSAKPVEAVEIKHGIQIDAGMVKDVIEKVKRTTIKRYYILSTNDKIKNTEEITELLINARDNHGCEIIPNGINATLKYYLRLVSNTDDFIENFVTLLETDTDAGYDIKKAWDDIQSGFKQED